MMFFFEGLGLHQHTEQKLCKWVEAGSELILSLFLFSLDVKVVTLQEIRLGDVDVEVVAELLVDAVCLGWVSFFFCHSFESVA